jgi:hypothetical protein
MQLLIMCLFLAYHQISCNVQYSLISIIPPNHLLYNPMSLLMKCYVFHCYSTTFSRTIQFTLKVKLSLCLTKHHAMNTYWESGGIAPRILNLGTRYKWVVSFTPLSLYSGARSLGSHWIGGWVSSRFSLNAVAKTENVKTTPVGNLSRSSSPYPGHYTVWATSALPIDCMQYKLNLLFMWSIWIYVSWIIPSCYVPFMPLDGIKSPQNQ